MARFYFITALILFGIGLWKSNPILFACGSILMMASSVSVATKEILAAIKKLESSLIVEPPVTHFPMAGDLSWMDGQEFQKNGGCHYQPRSQPFFILNEDGSVKPQEVL